MVWRIIRDNIECWRADLLFFQKETVLTRNVWFLLSLMFVLAMNFCFAASASSAAQLGQNQKTCIKRIGSSYSKLLSQYGIKSSSEVINDYAKLKLSADCYLEAWPRDSREVTELIRFAYQNNLSIRVRGNAHSVNGSSLPRFSELLIHTDNLNTIKFNKAGEVTVGAGIPMFLADYYINNHSDYSLPVINGGGIGPTLGGYISAGGLSSSNRSGFWNFVEEVTLVTGNGKILHLKRGDTLFPWLFGSMGQLGVITEARLSLIKSTKKQNPVYPVGLIDHISYQHENYFDKDHLPVYWFNLLIKPSELAKAKQELLALQNKYPDLLKYIPIYQWGIAKADVLPPLVYPKDGDFYSTGIWGIVLPDLDKKMLAKMEKDFNKLVMQHHYHRYIQAELTNQPKDFELYFGPTLYQKFYAIKHDLDPKMLINPGVVFEKK